MKFFILAIGLLATFLPMSTAMKKCLNLTGQTVHVEHKFLEQPEFFIPVHSDCDNCEKGDKNWTSITGRSKPHMLCYDMTGTTKDGGVFTADFECQYVVTGQGSCKLKTKVPPYLAGDMFLLKTDNSTYMAGASCIYGKENWWWVASTTDTLVDGLQEEIADHMHKLGFKKGNIAKEGEAALSFKELHFKSTDKCKTT